MNYVIAGYAFVLGLLCSYGVYLVSRRRSLTRLVARIETPGTADAAVASAPGVTGIAGDGDRRGDVP